MMELHEPILQVEQLKKYFPIRTGLFAHTHLRAVDGVSFAVPRGQTLGIVGESGSGKSVTQLALLGLLPSPPLKIEGGEALFRGRDLLTMSPAELRKVRGDRITMVFQEPMTSLNPYLRVGTQLIEPLTEHRGLTKAQARVKAAEALRRVGIPDPESAMRAYPHEFSGGMRQRVMIAMALTTAPDVLIADEPTTALDVTVQAQILELLKDLQRDTGMAVILITHDLGVVAGMADQILVMYAGRVFESGSTDAIFYQSCHPYTAALLRSTPRLDRAIGELPVIGGTPPDLARLGPGCPFENRCAHRMNVCVEAFPAAREASPGHRSFCYLEELPHEHSGGRTQGH